MCYESIRYFDHTIRLHCYLIDKGKPCSCEPIQDRYVKAVTNIVDECGLKFYIEELYDGWKTVWIFKDYYMLDIIRSLPKQPINIFDHWILGKAFGYSDEAIKIFIEKINNHQS